MFGVLYFRHEVFSSLVIQNAQQVAIPHCLRITSCLVCNASVSRQSELVQRVICWDLCRIFLGDTVGYPCKTNRAHRDRRVDNTLYIDTQKPLISRGFLLFIESGGGID